MVVIVGSDIAVATSPGAAGLQIRPAGIVGMAVAAVVAGAGWPQTRAVDIHNSDYSFEQQALKVQGRALLELLELHTAHTGRLLVQLEPDPSSQACSRAPSMLLHDLRETPRDLQT